MKSPSIFLVVLVVYLSSSTTTIFASVLGSQQNDHHDADGSRLPRRVKKGIPNSKSPKLSKSSKSHKRTVLPSASPSSSPTAPSPSPTSLFSQLVIEVKTDIYGSHKKNYWKLRTRDEKGIFRIVKQRLVLEDDTFYSFPFLFESDSCFLFSFYDDYGDGLTGKGSYFSVTWKEQLIIKDRMLGRKVLTTKFGSSC